MGERSLLLLRPQLSGTQSPYRPGSTLLAKQQDRDRVYQSSLLPPRIAAFFVAALTAIGLFTILTNLFKQQSISHFEKSPCNDFQAQCEIVAPYVFDSVHGLAKQWPNTYAPNGHSFVPAVIPHGTPLYHTRPSDGDSEIETPTWLSFDPEMGLAMLASIGRTDEHLFVATKPLQMLYIDGTGAALTEMGTLDSQTALLRGRVTLKPGDNFTFDDPQRGVELCQRARQMGNDGFIRMQAGFEVLVCERHSAGLKHVSVTNVTVPGQAGSHQDDPKLPNDPNRVPPHGFGTIFAAQTAFEWVRSGTWYYGGYGSAPASPKETRFHLDLCGFVSFYDPRLRSLQNSHHGGLRHEETFEMGWGLRRGHRLVEISREDARTVFKWTKATIQSARRRGYSVHGLRRMCSGTDWQALSEVITTQHKGRAKELAGVLARRGNLSDQEVINRVHLLSHAILHPFLQYPSSSGFGANESRNKAIHTCSTLYTEHLPADSYNTHEALIRDSIEIVLKNLCSWEWELFQWAEARTSNLLQNGKGHANIDLTLEIDLHLKKTTEMLKWIGWDLWDKCDEPCAWNEVCYIPMYPVVYAPGKHQGGPWGGSSYTYEEEIEFWRPKCVSLEAFDRWGGRVYDPAHRLPDPPWINDTAQQVLH